MQNRSPMVLLAVVLCALAAGVPPVVYGQTAQSPTPAGRQTPATPPIAQPIPGQKQSTLDLGIQQYKAGNYEEAFDALTAARDRDPNSSAAAYYLGITLMKMQLFDKAIPQLLASVTLQPPMREGFLELADAYYAMDKLDEALQALKVAQQERLDAGQVEFLRARIYAKKKNYIEALAGYEKAKTADTKLANAADFQIAMIRLRMGLMTEARDLFKSIADRDPASDLGAMARQQADDLAKQAERKYSFTAGANVQFQYDSNVILKPEVASAGTASISGEKDTATVLAVHAEFASVLSQPYVLKFLYNGYVNSYQTLKAYDVQSHTVGVEPGYRLGENSATMPVTFTYTLVDNKKYVQALGLTPTYSFITGADHYALATVRYQKKDYLTPPVFPEENRDATNLMAGVSWFRLTAGKKGFANLKYELDKENTVGANWSYLGNRAGAGLLYPLSDTVKLSLGIGVYRQEYDNIHSTFLVKRTDTSYQGSVQFLYVITDAIDAQAQYVAMKTDSTIAVYGYNKNIISIGLSARF